MNVRRESALRFDGGEVLKVVADQAAEVLDEPVEQRGEVQRVPRGRGVVVAVRINGQVRVRNSDGRNVVPSGAV
jgi:hypothetical protein